MLRIGLDFFKFAPRREERPEEWFQRFDTMLDEANRISNLGLSVTFQSWMLLSLLQLPPRKWSDLLQDLGHTLPVDRDEYIALQAAILRERTFESSAVEIRGQARNIPGGSGRCFTAEEAEPRPAFLCLGDPGDELGVVVGKGVNSDVDVVSGLSTCAASDLGTVDVYDGHYLVDGEDSDSDISSTDSQWDYENEGDPLSASDLQMLRSKSPVEKQQLYWAMRKAVRRYRASIGKLRPRRRGKGARF